MSPGIMVVIVVAIITAACFGMWYDTCHGPGSRPVKPVIHDPPPEQPPPRPTPAEVALVADCGDAPSGKYLSWPIPATIGLGLAGLAGAAAGSGGTPAGFWVAYALSPLNWAMVWAFFQIGKIGCPHCRRAVGGDSIRNAAIGTGLRCTQCKNVFKKPAA